MPYIWRWKDQISGYDSAYVALAATRRITLVTADCRLARAGTGHCRVELTA